MLEIMVVFLLLLHFVKVKDIVLVIDYKVYDQALRGLNTHDRFSVIVCKGDNFCDLMFAFQFTILLLKVDLLQKEECDSVGIKLFPFRVDPFSERN